MAQAIPQIVKSILRRPVVEQASGYSRSTLYRRICEGVFPKPIAIGGGRVGWASNEVQDVIDARIAGKSDEQLKTLVADLEAARGAA